MVSQEVLFLNYKQSVVEINVFAHFLVLAYVDNLKERTVSE